MGVKAQIDTMMQLDPTWNPHQKLEFFSLCVITTLSQIGQITWSTDTQLPFSYQTCLSAIQVTIQLTDHSAIKHIHHLNNGRVQ